MRFAYRLALEWGIDDVDAWLSQIDRRILNGWIAFNELEPIGAARADIRSALLGVALGNLLMDSDDSDAYELKHFLPFVELADEEDDDDDEDGLIDGTQAFLEIERCRQIAAIHNAGA